MKLYLYTFLISFIGITNLSKAQSLYFPPNGAAAVWDSISPSSLGWCLNEIDTLYDFLQTQNSKAFLVLKDGKIVLEKYFGTFTKDSLWYWASAGKTLTAFLIGKAQEEGFLSINDSSSQYLGSGWTSCTAAQEKNIKIANQLCMTSGLDDGVADNHCTLDTCLVYLADAGTRWAYHNAPYTLLEQVIENSSSLSINAYTQTRLNSLTGMAGFWFTNDYDNVFYSNARTMARFGLLALNNFNWNGTALLTDTTYISQLTNTSQNLNLSYGYLWWLNGKPSYMIPGFQLIIPGSIAPNAPPDMFSGIGKNGQIVSVCKSQNLVVIRMGNSPGTGDVSIQLLDQIWEKLNAAMCTITSQNKFNEKLLMYYPNPVSNVINVNTENTENLTITVTDLCGRVLLSVKNQNKLFVESLRSGTYLLQTEQNQETYRSKFIKQ